MARWPRTDLLELVGIAVPVLQAPMAGVATPEMAAAVTAAGGLGGIPAGAISDEALAAALAGARSTAPGPYNVNFFTHREPAAPTGDDVRRAVAPLAPLYAERGAEPPAAAPSPYPTFLESRMDVLLELRPEVVSFHFGLAEERPIAALREAGIRVLSSATTVAEAVALVEAGVDAVIAQGAEAGGHRGGTGLVGTMALVPQIADAVEVPVIAAGGIADGRGLAAAFALGASGVQVGTALLRSPESLADDPQRARLAEARPEDTIVTKAFTGWPARGLRNRVTEQVGEGETLAYPLQSAITRPLGTGVEVRAIWAGQALTLARAETAGATVTRIAAEARRVLAGLGGEG